MQPWQLNAQQSQQDALRNAEQGRWAGQSAMDWQRRTRLVPHRSFGSRILRLIWLFFRLVAITAIIAVGVEVLIHVHPGL